MLAYVIRHCRDRSLHGWIRHLNSVSSGLCVSPLLTVQRCLYLCGISFFLKQIGSV